MWVILFKKVWDIDALRCPMCGGRMKAISVIEHPSVIRRILEYLERRLPRLRNICWRETSANLGSVALRGDA